MSGEATAVIMCIYRRPHLLGRTLNDLKLQTNRPERIVLVNNNTELRDLVDRTIGQQAEVVHNQQNEGGWARFVQARRLSADGLDRVVFIDDDMVLEPGFLAALSEDYRDDAVVGPYAFEFHPPFDDYWARTRVPVGAEAHYVGTCGMIAPTRIFDHPGMDECPMSFRMVEDLWLSAFCRDVLGMRLVRSRAALSAPEGNDEHALWPRLISTKSEMLRWLHDKHGFPRY